MASKMVRRPKVEARTLTYADLCAIRKMPCGRCGAVPPHADGNWTQKHRLVPGSKGGKYTKKNTVPRCPSCHAKEPGHKQSVGFILMSRARRSAAHRGQVPWNKGKRGVQAAWWKGKPKSPETRSKMSAAHKGKHHTPEHRAAISAGMRGSITNSQSLRKA